MDLYHPQAPFELPSNQSSWKELQGRQEGRAVWVVVIAGELRCLLMFGRYPASWLPPVHLAQSLNVCFHQWPAVVTSSHTTLVHSWRTLGFVWRRGNCGLEVKCRGEGEVMLPVFGVLKLQVQVERAQWACICPLPLVFLQRWA